MADPPTRPITASDPWTRLKGSGIWQAPLPAIRRPTDRLLLRLLGALACRQVRRVEGLARVLPERGPFVLAANHCSRHAAICLPALLMLTRGGRPVHFLADWNFRLIPGASYLYQRSGAINVVRKPARPAILDLAAAYKQLRLRNSWKALLRASRGSIRARDRLRCASAQLNQPDRCTPCGRETRGTRAAVVR